MPGAPEQDQHDSRMGQQREWQPCRVGHDHYDKTGFDNQREQRRRGIGRDKAAGRVWHGGRRHGWKGGAGHDGIGAAPGLSCSRLNWSRRGEQSRAPAERSSSV